jgi:uncharacterized protein YhaN
MTDRLVIEEIRAESFGGLSNTTVELGAGGLVVVAGLNESGKTSLSELMSWLLVGPSGNAESAQRFGDPGEQISGRISGTLRDQEFRTTGNFKVLKAGAPNDGGLEIIFGEQRLDAAGWRGLLSGIDAAMLDAVYLMWGADLHDGDNVMAKIEEAALGGIPGSRNVGALRDDLETSVKSLLTSTAKNADSFKKLQSKLKGCNADMREIRIQAGEYADLQRDRANIQNEVEQVNARRLELASEISARDALLAVTEERFDLNGVRADLRDLDVVPDSWGSLVAAPDALTDAVGAVESAESGVVESASGLQLARDAAGLTVAEVSVVNVGQPDVISMARIGQQLSDAQGKLIESEDHLGACRADSDRKQHDLDRALVPCQGQTVEKLRGVSLESGDFADISTKIALWSDADSKVVLAQAEVDQRKGQLSELNEDAGRSRDAWELFGAGCTAQEWLRKGGTNIARSEPAERGPELWVFAIAAAVSVGSSFVLPRIAWSVVTVAAFVFAFLVQRSGKRRDSDEGVVPETPSEAAREAADAVLSSEDRAAEAERLLSSARRDLVTAERLRDSTARAAKERAQASGVDLPFGHAESKFQLDAINAAVIALGELGSSKKAVRSANTVHEERHDETERLALEVRTLLDNCGVPGWVQIDDAPEVIELFQRVTVARQAVDSAEGDRETVLEQYGDLIALVSEEIEGWARSAVVERCRGLAAIVDEREKLKDSERTLSRLIDKTMSGDERAREVQRGGHSNAELELQNARLGEQLSEVEDRRSELDKKFGAIGERLEQIAQESELARLSAEAGALDDASDDRVVDAAAHSVALQLLTQVAEEQRQANQPELVKRASELLATVQSEWEQILVSHDGSTAEVSVRGSGGVEVSAHQLSTGARALVYLSLRLAMADQDAVKRGFRFPIICDDPLIHIDDKRARLVLPLLAEAAESGHQVVLFTCHRRTVEAAGSVGAHVVPLDGGID